MTFTSTRAQMSPQQQPTDLSIFPAEVLDEAARVMNFGAGKHGRDNWRQDAHGGGDHIEAARRHLKRHKSGKLFDAETGFYHLAHALARVGMALGREQQRPKCPACEVNLPKLRSSPGLEFAGWTCPQCNNHYPPFRVANERDFLRNGPKERLKAPQFRILMDIVGERKRQDDVHGYFRKLGHLRRNAILGEEVGEVAKAINDRDYPNLREELVQVAACCVAWLEEIDQAQAAKAAAEASR